MAKSDKNDVLEEFTQAYAKVNGKQPDIQAKSGWYSVDGGKNVRLSRIQEMTVELLGTENTAQASSTSKTQKKPVPKIMPKTKSKKSGFSVKQFWADQLKADAPGSTPPR